MYPHVATQIYYIDYTLTFIFFKWNSLGESIYKISLK